MSPKRKRLVIVISAVVVAIVIIVPSVYVLYTKQEISVKEGTASYTSIGDFYERGSNNKSMINSYNATTVITEQGNNGFHLDASMFGDAYGTGSYGANIKLHALAFDLFFYLNGTLPYNLHPSGLVISVAPVAGSTSLFKSYLIDNVGQNDYGNPVGEAPNNVTASGTGTGNYTFLNLNLALLNDAGLRTNQTFHFSLTDCIQSHGQSDASLQYNTTYGISVTASLEGLSKPVSTTLYLFFIDIPKGS